MSKLFSRLTAAVLICGLIAISTNALAAGDGDLITGHWAETAITRALGDGLITEREEAINPDAPVTGGEMITILCRVFSTEKTADLTGVTDVDPDDWYYETAAQAVTLGIVAPVNGRLRLDDTVTRGKAFDALASAFQLVAAQPDMEPLTQFSDSSELTGRYKLAAAALSDRGFVKGDGSTIHIDSEISLGEFLTVLYRIVPNFKLTGGEAGQLEGGAVISKDEIITGMTYTDSVYFDCGTSSVSLRQTTAPCAVLRCDSLSSLSLFQTQIGRLVIAASSGDITLNPLFGSSVDTVVVGNGGGTVTLGGDIQTVEVTGDGRDVIISSAIQSLLVRGSGCTITVNPRVTVGTLTILGNGNGNTVTVNGSCGLVDIYGENTAVGGDGTIEKLVDYATDSAVTVNAAETSASEDYGLGSAVLSLKAPDNVPSYRTLKASVSITSEGTNTCLGIWYLDDTIISKTQVEPGTNTLSLSYNTKNTDKIPKTVTLTFVLYFEDAGGGYTEKQIHKDIVLESQTKFDAKEVMSLVKTGYQGDYTLEWAQTHDYDEALKTAWINYKGYSSKTDYLVWINLAYQRVNIFTGSAGNWKLEKSFLSGSGKSSTPTPVGVFTVYGRSAVGWTTTSYTVKPVVNFYGGYAFHSRLYKPNSTTDLTDSRIGFPISHGCIRMYDEDVQWIYDYIPTYTTVVVY